MQIYGDEFLNGLTGVNNMYGGMDIKAFVSNALNFRNNKAHQFIFINRRPIKDTSLSHAVYNAYEGILPKDKHPVFFLFLSLDPKKWTLMSILQKERSGLKIRKVYIVL